MSKTHHQDPTAMRTFELAAFGVEALHPPPESSFLKPRLNHFLSHSATKAGTAEKMQQTESKIKRAMIPKIILNNNSPIHPIRE